MNGDHPTAENNQIIDPVDSAFSPTLQPFARKIHLVSGLIILLFLASVFANIAHPLFWADESVTVVGAERVLHFGYPKMDDGKNLFIDLIPCWGQLYFSAPGVWLAERTDDIYLKTGIIRSLFAIAGIAGIIIFGRLFARYHKNRFERHLFFLLFLLFELISVSLTLHLREARYYSLSILLTTLTLCVYIAYRFQHRISPKAAAFALALVLWTLFNTYLPLYFTTLISIFLTEVIHGYRSLQTNGIRPALRDSRPILLAMLFSAIAALPVALYFNIIHFTGDLNSVGHFKPDLYLFNLKTSFGYFIKRETLPTILLLRLLVLANAGNMIKKCSLSYRTSNFLSVFILVNLFISSTLPHALFTRYFIFLQPVATAVLLLDLFSLLKVLRSSTGKIDVRAAALLFLLPFTFTYVAVQNINEITGHLYEMNHEYKGPLDYTIRYIKQQTDRPDTLIIAANYEETSYMYYLKSKVTVGYVGNNLSNDAWTLPDIIAFRNNWQQYIGIFNGFLKRDRYRFVPFEVYDLPVNNIPELNNSRFLPHQFRTKFAGPNDPPTSLYIREPL